MKIGMICRMDNSGLGTLSYEFYRHLKPDKVYLVSNGVFQIFPDRYENQCSKQELLQCDVIISFETFYEWDIVLSARQSGAKTVLMTMFEMSKEKFPYQPDVLWCPSKLDYDVFKDYSCKVQEVQVPVATDKLEWVERNEAKVFLHSGSHGGLGGRKGTDLIIDAMKYVNSDIEMRIFSWTPYEVADERVKVINVNFKYYWQLWRDGDVLVYPQDYNGICLPIVEAMSCGLGVITTDIYPFNEYMYEPFMFKHSGLYKTRAGHKLKEAEAAKIDPRLIAEKIDESATGKISIKKASEYGRKWAEENSWDKLLPTYKKLLKEICEEQ